MRFTRFTVLPLHLFVSFFLDEQLTGREEARDHDSTTVVAASGRLGWQHVACGTWHMSRLSSWVSAGIWVY
jgi:hypothetical protein